MIQSRPTVGVCPVCNGKMLQKMRSRPSLLPRRIGGDPIHRVPDGSYCGECGTENHRNLPVEAGDGV